MPDLGIGEAIAAITGGGSLLDLLGIGGAAAADAGAGAAAGAGLETGLATIGAGAADVGATAAGAGGLADLVGSGAGLFGGTTGLEGSLLAGGAAGGIPAAIGTGVAGGALGTAMDFLGAPAASGFNAAAVTPGAASFGSAPTTPGIGAPGGGPGVLTPPSGSFTPSGAGGTSVFDTGTSGISGVNAGGAPSATSAITPGGASASSIAAPSGVAGVTDPTAAGVGQAAGAGGAPAAGQSSSISDLLDKAGSGAMKSLTSNPLGTALGAAGLGYNIFEGQKNTANQNALTADAKTATANSEQMVQSGEALQQYLTNGTLPPAYQQQVDQAINDAKTKAISNAAAQGQPTDPTQNTSLAATLAGIDNQRAGMQAQVASTLFSSGTSLVNSGATAAGLSGQLYQSLVANDTASAANTGKAIATLAAALNGKSNNTIGGTNIQVSQAA
jgi:hypothetical protein